MQPKTSSSRTLVPPTSRRHGAVEATAQAPTAAAKPTQSRWVNLLLVVLIYVAVISAAALLWPRPLLLTALYVPLSCFVLYRWRGLETLACFLTGFVLGPAGEFVAVAGGAWSYAEHQSLPLWLPLAWGIAVVVMKQIVVLVGVWVPNDKRSP